MTNKTPDQNPLNSPSGILLVNKPKGKTSFSLIGATRKLFNIRKVGHAGTLDPFATGVMIILVGKKYTRLSDKFLTQDKEYIATLKLGARTDSYDVDGTVIEESSLIPSLEAIEKALEAFQGEVSQVPPMFSAKKVGGKKLCDLARQGITIERKAVKVQMETTLLHYEYPYLSLKVACSKGTYIRSIAEDLGKDLGCFAHLTDLSRTRSGRFTLDQCVEGSDLFAPEGKPLPTLLPSL